MGLLAARARGKVVIEIPGYEIMREIGASRTATVYLAVQVSLERDVALKVMAPALADEPALTQCFMQEARTLASLAHPHIVAVYDVDVAPDNQPYFSMQYLPGGDFAARVRSGIGDAELIETLDGMGQALDYVHQRGLIHRDVTPGNILYDVAGVPLLTDFGIARALGSGAGSSGIDFSVVTGHYMSPEQARGTTLDARADLYSLGALTYFGLTGKPPYDGADGFAVAYAHVFEAIPRLPPARQRWQPLIDRALAKDPTQRFASAREFLDALNKLGQPRAAAPEPMPPPASASLSTEPTILPSAPLPPIAEVESALPAPGETAHATPQRPLPVPAAVMPASGETPTPVPPARIGGMRWWPLLMVLAGLVAIGFAAYTQFAKRKPSADTAAQVAAPPAPQAAPKSVLPPVVVAAPPLAPALPSAPEETAPAPANPDAPAATQVAAAAATDATAIPSLDAAAEAAVGEFVAVTDLSKVPTVVDPLNEAIRLGRIASAGGKRLTTPPGNNALEYFQFALKKDPTGKIGKSAKEGIVDIAKKYIELANKAQSSSDTTAYLQFLTNADDVAKTLDDGADVRKDVASRRVKAAEPYVAQAKGAAAEWDKSRAKAAYDKALEIDPNNAAAREGLKFVATIGEPGFVFRDKLGDGGQGPDLLILGGSRIAVARRDVTRAEFRRYWNAVGRSAFAGKEPACRDRESFFRSSKDRTWQSPGFEQDDSHPVVCVNWPEAAAYVQWLSRETGKHYRLLSAAEFDLLAARAPSDCAAANLADGAYNRKYESRDGAACDDGFAATSPAAHFEPAGGVYDPSGNVRVWVAACGNGVALPSAGACRDYLAKGRAWLSAPKEAATHADSFGAEVALNSVGFRVVREIDN
jgi:serine/threonine protein kinase/tetratricopeptide (TPR) repeat protein